MNFGVAVTYPLFIALSALLSIPLNALVDALWAGTTFNVHKWIGTVLLVVSFLIILLLPDKHDEALKKMLYSGFKREPNRMPRRSASADATVEEEASGIILRQRANASGASRNSAAERA